MDVYGRYNNLRNSWPVRTAEAVVMRSARPVLQRMVGVSLTEPEIAKRAAETPVHKAELGALAVRQGMAAQDTELLHFGGAMVLQAVDDAAKKQDLIVQDAVTKVASSLPAEGLVDNPLVAPQVADRAASIIGEMKDTPRI